MADSTNDDIFSESESKPKKTMSLQLIKLSDSDDLFRPSLADDQKIGFFRLDRNTQTEESEIVDLKEMTSIIQQLLEDAAVMKRDIHFARHVMQADFEQKLQQKSIDLYCRVNEKMDLIEQLHEERVGTVRRAFKQQLADGIARMHTHYAKSFESELDKDKTQKDAETLKWEAKIRELQSTIQRNESVIQMLQQQLGELHDQEDENDLVPVVEEEEVEPTPPPPPVPESSKKSRKKVPAGRPESVLLEIEGLQDEIDLLEHNVERLEKDVHKRDTSIHNLKEEIQNLNDELEREKIMVEQLKHEKDELNANANQDKQSSKRQMESQKLQMQKAMADQLQQAREKAMEEAQEIAQSSSAVEQQKINKLTEENKILQQLLSKAKAKSNVKSRDAVDLEKAKQNEARLLNESSRLKKEIERVHKTWEKKFAILQQSLHALKDESYLRQTLQKQSAQLHQASISYAYDQPTGIAPTQSENNIKSQPLPDIPKRGESKSPADFISYTVSAPSGRATALFSTEENQIMSDTEQDLPAGVVPITAQRSSSSKCGSGSRPTSHTVHMTSVQAQ